MSTSSSGSAAQPRTLGLTTRGFIRSEVVGAWQPKQPRRYRRSTALPFRQGRSCARCSRNGSWDRDDPGAHADNFDGRNTSPLHLDDAKTDRDVVELCYRVHMSGVAMRSARG